MQRPHSPLYYADYLQLDRLLASQSPKSWEHGKPAHDEMLFIIVHQAYELWFKQILHELDSVIAIFQRDYVEEKAVGIAVDRLSRITEIQKILIDQLRVLETMTPLDFLEFRDFLHPASGFQSVQFRLLENKLGLRPGQRQLYDKSAYYSFVTPEHQKIIQQSEDEPSLFQLIERWLERTPFLNFKGFDFWTSYRTAVTQMFQNDHDTIRNNPFLSDEEKSTQLQMLAKTGESFAALFDEEKHRQLIQKGQRRLSYKATHAALLITLYRDEPILHLPFRLLTVLIDIDELLTTWRYRHALMVQRMIGSKIGTGGSSGYHYLRTTIESHKIFTDLFNLSTFLIPRSALPELPAEFKKNLGFYYDQMEK
ncbi:MAG: tryptophan 2,3-dioxygenase [candidate division KSB1 bacterium]|nr:tryptophan 2,3-dioxygenase [candidate division KSB1 bacterium]MDZ7365903.1 tryptophan 2,3-dioxygenase [candidate division KSB1 bacterium]MDZ7403863.1 tryptophan 2,3-dioxygenase [candidate division KSB1 bacterium]